MRWSTALTLGRVANLPSVWTNTLVGVMLAGGDPTAMEFVLLATALSALYLGGMFLNDACDARWDLLHRPERPIPSGQVSAQEVWRTGLALLTLGPVLLWLGRPGDPSAAIAALGLSGVILAYDLTHKQFRHSAWLMGSCRLMVYLVAALFVGGITPAVLWAGTAMLCYIASLTYVAQTEHLNQVHRYWPLLLFAAPVVLVLTRIDQAPMAIPVALLLCFWLFRQLRTLLPGPHRQVASSVGALLAAIPLVDATLLAAHGHVMAGALALLAFLTTLQLQRRFAAT
ncbi:UbiA family prenyltransferase [Ferrimonas marina]|uniref:4-hydroxybenzoate polyprenyltransferase n=1 Tax=Ferrimonas marina TaxID=299255 RepID=A0A1M5Y0P8_9GAMM|nr:UbiA family prenyltransferase [Ferrimonas marina]SHI05103.1 4-hydroxybenzoate polyprenyltransferase [Ferrimonas marina]